MYNPDPSFMRKLKALDPNLGCVYVQEHEHFVITYKRAIGEPYNVLTIKNPDGSFRHPDERDIVALQKGDLMQVPMKDRLRQLSAYMEKDREDRARKRKQEVRDMTKDSRIQLMKHMAKLDSAMSGGKENYHFRRINLRPRGKVFSPSSTVGTQP